MARLLRRWTETSSNTSLNSPVPPANDEVQVHRLLVSFCLLNDANRVNDLLEQSGRVISTSQYQRARSSPMHTSASLGHLEVVTVLLKHGFEVDVRDASGNTPLQVAARNGHRGCVRLLLRYGADPTLRNTDGLTALHWLAGNGRELLVDEFFKKGPPALFGRFMSVGTASIANTISAIPVPHPTAAPETQDLVVNAEDSVGRTPLHYAVQNGHSATARKLISYGADPTRPDRLGRTPLYSACEYGMRSCVNLLLSHGMTLVPTHDGTTPLKAIFLRAGISGDLGGHVAVLKLLANEDPSVVTTLCAFAVDSSLPVNATTRLRLLCALCSDATKSTSDSPTLGHSSSSSEGAADSERRRSILLTLAEHVCFLGRRLLSPSVFQGDDEEHKLTRVQAEDEFLQAMQLFSEFAEITHSCLPRFEILHRGVLRGSGNVSGKINRVGSVDSVRSDDGTRCVGFDNDGRVMEMVIGIGGDDHGFQSSSANGSGDKYSNQKVFSPQPSRTSVSGGESIANDILNANAVGVENGCETCGVSVRDETSDVGIGIAMVPPGSSTELGHLQELSERLLPLWSALHNWLVLLKESQELVTAQDSPDLCPESSLESNDYRHHTKKCTANSGSVHRTQGSSSGGCSGNSSICGSGCENHDNHRRISPEVHLACDENRYSRHVEAISYSESELTGGAGCLGSQGDNKHSDSVCLGGSSAGGPRDLLPLLGSQLSCVVAAHHMYTRARARIVESSPQDKEPREESNVQLLSSSSSSSSWLSRSVSGRALYAHLLALRRGLSRFDSSQSFVAEAEAGSIDQESERLGLDESSQSLSCSPVLTDVSNARVQHCTSDGANHVESTEERKTYRRTPVLYEEAESIPPDFSDFLQYHQSVLSDLITIDPSRIFGHFSFIFAYRQAMNLFTSVIREADFDQRRRWFSDYLSNIRTTSIRRQTARGHSRHRSINDDNSVASNSNNNPDDGDDAVANGPQASRDDSTIQRRASTGGAREEHDVVLGAQVVALEVHRDAIFETSCEALSVANEDSLLSGLAVQFAGEEGVGTGVLREWFSLLSKELLNADYALFTTSSNGMAYQPNSTSYVNPDHLAYFEFTGRVIGLALYYGCTLDVHFTRSFYKQILGKPVSYEDIASVDPGYHKNLQWILDNHADGLDLTFQSDIDLFGKLSTVELKPKGGEINVTEENKLEYVQLVTELKMVWQIEQQIRAFLRGFHSYIPPALISIFNEYELELLVSGLPEVDVTDWENHTEYIGFVKTDQTVKWFWDAVRTFDANLLAALLQFATGCARVPVGGFAALHGANGFQKFAISRWEGANQSRLPSASTCFNLLKLPVYDSKNQLCERLTTAVMGCESFDYM